MHLLALVLIFGFAVVTAVSAASFGAEERSRKALVPARIRRRRPERM